MPAIKDKDPATGEIRWRYRFSHGGKRFSGSTAKGHNTKKAAERIERQLLDRLEARMFTGTIPTVTKFAVTFLEHQAGRTKPHTRKTQASQMKHHVLPHIGKHRLDAIGKKEIDDLVTAWLAIPLAAKSINTMLGTVRRMFSLAVEWNMIARVPKVTFMRIGRVAPRFLTDEESISLVAAADARWRAMIVVALRTGLRIGELRGLQWADVNLDRKVLTVARTDPGRKTMDATTPKGNRERTVPLTPDAVAAFASVRPEKPRADGWVWPALLKRAKETRARCRSEKGCWAAIVRIANAAKLTDVGWHTLRHTYASQLVMRGVPIRLIQKWLGHASIKETEKYSHLSPDFGETAADVLDFPLTTPDPSCQPATNRLPEGGRE